MLCRVRRIIRIGVGGQIDPGDERFQREAQRDLDGIFRNFDISYCRSDFVCNTLLAKGKHQNRNGSKQKL